MQVKGIDVSNHQGVIDWEKVKAAGVQFAMLRAGFGVEHPKQIDKQFERNYSECKRLGIPVGAYHYSYAESPDDAKKELEFFLKLLSGKQFEYPVCYDLEEEKLKKLPKSVLTDNVIAFCGGLERAGYYAALYSNPDWLYNYLERKRLTRFDLWLAEWRTVKKYPYACGIWQHTQHGKVDGIDCDVDLDIAYKDYPTIVKGKGLNGFTNASEPKATYTVTATKQGMDITSATKLTMKLRDLDMSVKTKEEK